MTQDQFPPNALSFEGNLEVALDPSPLLADTFDFVVDTVNLWSTGGTVPTASAGTLTVSPATTALAVSSITSRALFPLLGNMYNVALGIIKTDAAAKTGNKRFMGLGNAAVGPTVALPVQDGVGFVWDDTAGALSGAVFSAGTQVSTVALTRPADGGWHRYATYFKTSRVFFEIDNVVVGSVAYPNPSVAGLPLLMVSVNGAGAVSPAATFQASFLGVGDTGRNNRTLSDGTYPWRKAAVDATGAQLVKEKRAGAGTTSSVTATTTTGTILAGNNSRTGATVYNEGPSVLYLNFGGAASLTAYAVQVPPGGYYEVPYNYIQAIAGITSAGTAVCRMVELI